MTASPEQHQTDQDSVSSCPKLTDSIDDKEEKKDEDANNVPTVSGDETTDGNVGSEDNSKRFLPAYKKANAALTFPEKMMNLMRYVEQKNKTEKEFCVSWLPEGKAFVIYNIKEFTSSVVPKFFKASKFCSFTRKLYRWGFRQLNRGIGPDEPIIFGNEYFQRDNADLMVNMRSITAASIRKRESDLLRHMLASKKRALMSLDGASNAAYQDSKHLNMLLNNTPFDQKQQNASLTSAANTMATQQRLGGGGFSTDLGHLDNQSLQMMYQSLTNKNGSGDSGISPILSDAMSQMNNSSYNFNGASSHPQEFKAMSSMHMANNSPGMISAATSNYMSHMNGETNGSINNARMNDMANNARLNNMGGNYNNNSYNGGLSNNMFPSDSMYGNGAGNRGNGGFNLPQQYSSGGPNCDNAIRKNFMNRGEYGNMSMNMNMNMNINQQLFNLSTPGTAGGSDEMYFGGQY